MLLVVPLRVDETELTVITHIEHDGVGSVHHEHVHGEHGREAYIQGGIGRIAGYIPTRVSPTMGE